MAMTFATNIEADGNNTRSVGTNTNKFILNGTGNYASFYGTCSTAKGTSAKAVVCPEFSDDNLVEGTTIRVKFSTYNSATTPTLKINGGTAKTIYRYGTTKPGTNSAASWYAGEVVSFTYNGSAWVINSYNAPTTVTQNAVISTDNEYCLLHSYNATTTSDECYSVTKSSATINPSTGQISVKGKPVLYGEYSASSAPVSPIAGQLWLKDSTTVVEAKVLVVSTTASSLPTTITNSSIKSDMEVIKSEIGTPSVQTSDLTVTTSDGSATISGAITGSTTIKLWLMRGR